MASKLEIRMKALEATLQAWKDRAFCMPKRDCVKLMLFCLKKMGVKVPKSDKLIGYKTPLQARATLQRVYGVQTVPEMMDKFFDRIALAECLPGDIVCAPGFEEGTLGAVGIYYGNNLLICYEQEHDHPVIARIEPDEGFDLSSVAAWRSLP